MQQAKNWEFSLMLLTLFIIIFLFCSNLSSDLPKQLNVATTVIATL